MTESLLAAVHAAAGSTAAPISAAEVTPDMIRATFPAAASAISVEGATAERQRIAGIRSAAFPGQKQLKDEMIADGKTTVGEAALRFNQAEKASGAARLQALKDADKKTAVDAAPHDGLTAAADSKPKETPKTPEGWKAEFAASADIQHEFLTADAYVGFKRAEAAGQVKILRNRAAA